MSRLLILLISLLLTGCTTVQMTNQKALSIVQSRPEVVHFLKLYSENNEKTDIIAEKHNGIWEVGVYVVLDDHMSTFNWYNLDENGSLVGFRDKYDGQGNFICSTATNPNTCK